MVIDEIQRVLELLLAIKEQVDTDPRPDYFLLTGSARVLGLRTLPDALPGRMETIELWPSPVSQGEIDGNPGQLHRRGRFLDLITCGSPGRRSRPYSKVARPSGAHVISQTPGQPFTVFTRKLGRNARSAFKSATIAATAVRKRRCCRSVSFTNSRANAGSLAYVGLTVWMDLQ